MKDGILNAMSTMFFEVWLWITIGMLAIIAFFGRRLLGRWDKVMDSHMPDHVIENHLSEIRDDMEECQTQLAENQKSNYDKLNKGIGEVHSRLDNLYELLLQRRR